MSGRSRTQSGAARKPRALITPAASGTTTERRAERRADADRVHRAGAAEREERQRCAVLAALDCVHARGVRHVLVDDRVDPPRGLARARARAWTRPRARSPRRAASRSSDIRPPRKKSGIEIAEHEVGVGHRRLACRRGRSRPAPDRRRRCRGRP